MGDRETLSVEVEIHPAEEKDRLQAKFSKGRLRPVGDLGLGAQALVGALPQVGASLRPLVSF